LHTNFKLSSAGGDISIFYKNPKTNQLICLDSTSYGDYSLAAKGIPIGLYTDGQGNYIAPSIRHSRKTQCPLTCKHDEIIRCTNSCCLYGWSCIS
jgi:hypothetical protein